MSNALNSDQNIRHRLSVARLPTMPQILIKLVELCHDENVSFDALANLIAKDAAVTMKILGAANSSVYPHHIHKLGLEQSLLTLGMDNIKTLLISESIFHVFSGFNKTESFDLREFWKHSLTVALAAQKIAAMTNFPYPEEAYLAGLVHDVGRLALLSVAPKEYSMLFSHVDDISLCHAEERTFQINHAEVGSWLIERFHLDSFLADSVLYHHESATQVTAAHPLIRIVILADLIACHGPVPPAVDVAQLLFNLDAEALKNISLGTEKRVQEVADFLKIDLSGTKQALAVPYPSKSANDESDARDKLALEVQQVILASEASRSFNRANDEKGVLLAVIESAALLFGFEDMLFLMRDDINRCLRGVSLKASRQRLAEFAISLEDGGNIPVALEQKQVVFLDAGSNVLNLVEKQLFRLLDAEHLVCLPLFYGQHSLGVLIAPAMLHQLAEFRSRPHLLRAFAGEAAVAIHAVRAKVVASEHIAEDYRLASRRIVHEASNPLSIIKNYIAVLETKMQKKESVETEMSLLGQEIDRVGQILRGFSESQSKSIKVLSGINHVVADVVKFLQVTEFIPSSIRVETKLQADLDKIEVDRNSLKQILVNLIKNSVEAIQQNGEVVITTFGYVNRNGRLYCVLTVEDNGPGISPTILAKLYSPVRSAKSAEHAGLGLSIVHDLVQSLEGVITCRSQNNGTTFEILLPLSGGPVDDIDDIPPKRSAFGGNHGID